MPSAHTISSSVPRLVAEVAAREGVDAQAVLRAAGLASEGADPDVHVEVGRYFDAWRVALARVAPGFPLRVAAASRLEDSEVFGFLAMSCETLGEAYARTAAYRALYNHGARWEMEVVGDALRLLWYPWPGGSTDDAALRAAMEFQVADMAISIERLGVLAPRARAVGFAHASPPEGELAAYAATFGVAPRFGVPLYELRYAADLPAQRIVTFNSRLRDYFERACRELLERHEVSGGAPVAADVRRRLVLAMDGGDTTIEATAKALGMSPRTLQRRLGDEGTRYQDVLDEIRAELAKRYLARGTISASEVAYLVGFTEPPAFFKAFKRWTGMTPGAFQGAR